MSSYSWQLPGPPSGVGGAPGGSASSATARTRLGGLLDQEIDPVTLDYIDTDDGAWSDTADSRSIVMIMLETEYGRSYSAPTDGTRIRERLRGGDPVTAAFVVAEITRAMNVLAADGVLANFSIVTTDTSGALLVDETGRFSPELRWTDLATGSPVDLVFTPSQG